MADDTADKNQQTPWAPGQAPWDRSRVDQEPDQPAYRRPAKTMLGFNPRVPDEEVLPFERADEGPPDVENDFEAWAQVSAKLLKRSAKERQLILGELDLEFVWPYANERWSAVLANEVVEERERKAKRYCEICAEEMKRRRSGVDDAKPSEQQRFIKVTPVTTEHRTTSDDGPPTVRRPQMIGPLAPQEAKIDFVDRLAPPDIQPQMPQPGQQSTAAQDMRQVASAIQAANAALQWPVEKFAKFCAEVDHEPQRTQLIAAHYGLRGEAIEFVREGWQEKLEADTALRAQWSELVDRYRLGLRSASSAKKTPSQR